MRSSADDADLGLSGQQQWDGSTWLRMQVGSVTDDTTGCNSSSSSYMYSAHEDTRWGPGQSEVASHGA